MSTITKFISDITGQEVTELKPVNLQGYTRSRKWVASLSDGSQVFVKQASPSLAPSLRYEHMVYQEIQSSFMPKLVGWKDGEEPVLVRENLPTGWLDSWTPEVVERVTAVMEELAAYRVPDKIRSVEQQLNGFGWSKLDETKFLQLGLCSEGWLKEAWPTLRSAEADADVEGPALLHMDLRLENICLMPDRIVLVDWDHACQGNGMLDRILWLISLPLSGGGQPWSLLTDADPRLVSVITGYIAAQAYLPPPKGIASSVRQLQKAQVTVGLRWLSRLYKLPESSLIQTQH